MRWNVVVDGQPGGVSPVEHSGENVPAIGQTIDVGGAKAVVTGITGEGDNTVVHARRLDTKLGHADTHGGTGDS